MLIEFSEPDPLLEAAKLVHEAGFEKLDAYTPYPMEDLSEAIGFHKDRVALITLIGGLIGGIGGFFMQWYANVIDYPINVAGKPDNSWPAFIPITFELTVLGASLFAGFGMMLMNRLPKLWHPVFYHPDFQRASRDRFFLCIGACDAKYDPEKIRSLVSHLAPLSMLEVDDEET
jgi:hypothetical protein